MPSFGGATSMVALASSPRASESLTCTLRSYLPNASTVKLVVAPPAAVASCAIDPGGSWPSDHARSVTEPAAPAVLALLSHVTFCPGAAVILVPSAPPSTLHESFAVGLAPQRACCL